MPAVLDAPQQQTRKPTRAATSGRAAGQTLPRANVRRPGDFPDDVFENVGNVPVFAEHETVTKAGKKIQFGRSELEAIVDRCNRRIRETGDYAAVTIGHTPSPEAVESGSAKMPDIVGYAGSFKLGVLGEEEERQRYAILADMHFYKDEMPRVRRNPRRSPEVWLEDRFEEIFLDPIALLGAEAPRLDMGLLYSAVRHGRTVEKYAAACGAGPMSVGIKTDDVLKNSSVNDVQTRGESTPSEPRSQPMAISPDDVNMIVEALDNLDWVQWCRGKMAEEQGPSGALGTPAAPGPEAAGSLPISAGDKGAAPAAPSSPPPPAAGAHAPAGGLPKPPAVEAHKPPEKKDAAQYAAGPEAAANADAESERMEYAAKSKKPKYMKYMALHKKYGGDQASTYQQVPPDAKKEEHVVPPGGAEIVKNSAEQAGSADGKDSPKPAAATVDGLGGSGEAATTYQPGKKAEQYARINGNVQRLDQELQETRRQLEVERGARVSAERYSKLQELSQLHAFDLDQAAELSKYGKMSDEQFAAQLEFIESNVPPIPMGDRFSGGLNAALAASTQNTDLNRPGGKPERAKYSKATSDRALQICLEKRERGEDPSYEMVLEALHAGQAVT
ncbi:MAG TPA: hypothetical protein VG125_19665 [Pirellulales bacterium]|jgi:hypothetical protein|nr:hypothetical protein [Pirellulales bacterium]